MADQQAGSSNAVQIEFWNSAASRAWADEHERMDRAVAEVTKALLDLAAAQPGERVLDIGCGGGTTVLELAARVGPNGHVLGADIAAQSVARTRERIADAGLRHAEAIVADVSSHSFGADSFDLSFSRFGVMFFSDPAAAFANVRGAMKPGGRVAVAVFRVADLQGPGWAKNTLHVAARRPQGDNSSREGPGVCRLAAGGEWTRSRRVR